MHLRPVLFLPVLVLFAATCPAQGSTSPPASRPASRPGLHAAFDKILRDNVRDELVDYRNIRTRHRQELAGYLDALARTKVEDLSEKERLAFYINLYNATMIQAVIDRLRPGWTPASDDFSVFEEPLVRLRTGRISLNHLENEILRKRFREPRIHVALVCGARSCPPLLPRAYQARDLDRVLEANMKRFLADPSRNRIDHAGKRLYLSKIFEWYAEDFGGLQAVPAWVDRYVEAEVRDYRVSFLEYSWELNIAPPRRDG